MILHNSYIDYIPQYQVSYRRLLTRVYRVTYDEKMMYNTIFNIVKRDITNMEQNIQYSIDCYEM